MVPIRALGLLLCVQLCGGERRGGGQPWGRDPSRPRAGLSTLLAAGTGELRLVDGGGRCAGRVEVKYKGEWGSVCSYDFDWEARWAIVVCRQLGCGPVARASPYAPFGQGTGRIWLQPFFCLGNEAVLHDCPNFGWGRHFCNHERDVGVTCAEAVELRLVAGWGPCAGRVEAKLRGLWGSVADDNWDMEDGEVVCQQLGCGSVADVSAAVAPFDKGDGPISLALIDCRGDEAALWDCEVRGWGPYTGIHDYDTAVICQGFARLVGGDGACAGRLEVRRGKAWTSVCEDHVDIKAAQVVCRELGCGTVLAVPGSSPFGAGTRQLWEEGFECTGTEPLLAACARRPPRNEGCTGHASIICSSYTGFRLADNSSGCAGRVEVEAEGTWGSLCATGWDLPDAHVLCHHLGCGPAAAVPPGGSFGGGDGPLRQDTFGCGGSERHPGECAAVVLGKPACPPGHAAAVNCSGIAEPLRLVEGESRCDGRLEVASSPGAWARVLVGLRGARDASVVCRQLGCGVPEKVYAVPGSGATGPRCAGTEESLATCNVSGTATAPTGSPEEVAVVCSGSRRVRLVGGPGRCAGRVEVYVNGTWGSVCQETWDLQDAAVVCRQLGCGTALAAPGSARFGPGTWPPWPDAGGCAGTEESLWDCPASARHGCRRGGGAGAVCSEQLSLRLVGGSSRCEGHLEVLYNGTWGRVCANGTSPATAAAVCRQLGCGAGGRLGAAPARDPAPAWLAWVGCKEGARSLWHCPSAPWSLQACSLGRDARVSCDEDGDGTSGTPTPSPGSRCPEGAACTGSSARARSPPRRAAPATVPVLTPPDDVPAGVPSGSTPAAAAAAAAAGTLPVPTVLCAVLGTLLCLALGVLAAQACRAWARRRGPGRAADAVSDAVYEELDYALTPEYQEVPSPSGSLSERSGTKLPDYTGDSMEESDPREAPDSLAQHGPPDGYDDAVAVPEESPAPGAGDAPEGMAQTSWDCVPPTGGSSVPPGPPGATRDPPAQPPGGRDYDDVGIGTLGTSL
ncbi:scavenger receptor cysteine-rich type 1 protein M130-like [Mycteria americana]|uniref:scavenger receptor cysteine-rich type 1 protein M130-like n=1 Tax=Mycteria americana TaxID=33587 RepID=UPI003F582953